MRHWLMKSEPETYSLDDLKSERRTLWNGVRNYQARNFMMNEMKVGDSVFFYHSNAKPPAVVGLARVSAAAVADPTQFDRKSEYFDEKATADRPIWFCVEVEFVKALARPVSIEELRAQKALAKMALLQRGQRLSVQPVSAAEAELILKLAGQKK